MFRDISTFFQRFFPSMKHKHKNYMLNSHFYIKNILFHYKIDLVIKKNKSAINPEIISATNCYSFEIQKYLFNGFVLLAILVRAVIKKPSPSYINYERNPTEIKARRKVVIPLLRNYFKMFPLICDSI